MTCKAYEEIGSPEFHEKLRAIYHLLEEAYEHYFSYMGHCKSSEGWVSIQLPAFFWTEEHEDDRPEIQIYSYVLGPHRNHGFPDIDRALAAVKEWHRQEMAYDPSQLEDTW